MLQVTEMASGSALPEAMLVGGGSRPRVHANVAVDLLPDNQTIGATRERDHVDHAIAEIGQAIPSVPAVVLAHARDVERLLAGPLPRRGPAWAIAGLPPTEAVDRARRLAELRAECGCGTGAACAMSAVVLVVPWLVIAPMPTVLSITGHILTAMGLVIVAGGVGKTLGITRARRQLRRELGELRNRFFAMYGG